MPETFNRPTFTDEELVRRVLAGEREEYGLLVERYWRTAVAVAFATLASAGEAEEVAQESLVAAYEKLSTLRDARRFCPWLMRIVRRRASEHAKRKARTSRAAVDEGTLVYARSSNPGLSADEIRNVREAVLELPEKLRRAVVLRFVEEMSAVEIGERLGKRPGTVRVWLHRAYVRLRRKLAPMMKEAGDD